jgi:hypothetical protein
MERVDFNLLANEFSNLSKEKQKAFILILFSRQYSVYKKLSKGKEWSREKEIEEILNKCWNAIINNSELEYELLDICIECNPENFDYSEQDDEKITMLITTIDNLTAYLRLVIEHEEIDATFSRCNYDYLEVFLYQYYNWKPLSTNLVENHELVLLEYRRSLRDVKYLQSTENMESIYKTYCDYNESILENYWFNENF